MAIAGQPSRTAVVVSLMRALHTKFDRPALIDDTWADRLVTDEECRGFADVVRKAGAGRVLGSIATALAASGRQADERFLHHLWHGLSLYGGVIIRQRYTEDRIADAAARGVRQYATIGAGFDSFGLRRPESLRDVDVFEVDHQASQELKRGRLAAAGVTIPPGVHFVAADLAREDLGAALARSAYRMDEPSILSWLGVTMYLTREANFATLRSVAKFAAAGSELVFTYIEREALESGHPGMEKAKAVAKAMGEPWVFGFDPGLLAGELEGVGLELVEDLDSLAMRERYCAGRSDEFTPGRAGRVALARVKRKM